MNLLGLRKAIVFSAISLVLVLSALGVIAKAQAPTGSVTGLITDSSGAAIGNANVLATNTGTMVTYKSNASASGIYVLPTLPIGPYSIRATAPGFEGNERTGVTIAVDQHAELNFILQPGSTSQTITVSADASQIETETHSIG